jgi:hypothetical protein
MVRDSLAACGWEIEIADARKVKAIAPLACKTDRVDACVLADLVRQLRHPRPRAVIVHPLLQPLAPPTAPPAADHP